jgi:glycosyltransferase involved in cell wall biosynthesis
VPRPPEGRLRRREYEDFLTHVPLSYAALRALRPDIAHAWFTTDGLAAVRWKRKTGGPAVHSYMGIPDHAGLNWKRKRLQITLDVMAGCDVTVALSQHVASEFRRWLGYDPPVIEPPVDVDFFKPGPPRFEAPTVVCAATLDDADDRKRPRLLVEAWPHVLKERPGARLILNRPRDPSREVQAAGVETADMDDRHELARLYAQAWASALPSRDEAFGLVLAEAMACGTPGVGSNLDGIPEVIDSPEVGRLFDGEDPKAIARAILETFELAQDPRTAEACRARAMRLSRKACTDAYLRLYDSLR